ncbi:NAD(P)/FAD-dependent oxidoreductase [Glutamicibacter nicotianae]|uniref:NAD(P)/FAD-dependent oxidoreductase n=1 Tax=Glutamicibacter nicotianae TaxID=37929 RepID=UPI00195914AF|nr:FAD-dependent oxidoreductase [Glutamicibacter nicotianae]MBM7769353.1 glycine/D-amino acid oxidase-like deaminating enzyme [Glutamicibacter nicotianae]
MATNNELTFDRHEAEVSPALIARALADAKRTSYWLDNSQRPTPHPALHGSIATDLLVIGGGYTGLWTALQAKERDPSRKVVLIEGQCLGWAASGRNGGFCEASLVHGEANGANHLPEENELLAELGAQNLDEFEATVQRYAMDVDFIRQGSINVATEQHQIAWVAEEAEAPGVDYLDADAVKQLINSPDFLAGSRDNHSTALIHPAKLVWELARVCRELGVEFYEHTHALEMENTGTQVQVLTADGQITAQRVALATNVFPSLLKRHRARVIPVYDYALMTEPLTAQQRTAIGWADMVGLADLNNRFHYARPTIDAEGNFRLLYGGYDAVYHFGGKVRSSYDTNQRTFEKLAAHFFGSFPDLMDVKFSHAWGGAIDTCSRFFTFFDLAYGGKVAYCAGFTGLGVGATRFGAKVMLDLLSGKKTELTELELVRTKPIPFPPEPAAWVGVKLMTSQLAKADRNHGERSAFLKLMDKIGMGFDS